MQDYSLAQAFDTQSRIRSARDLARRFAAGAMPESEVRAAEAVMSVLAEDPVAEVRLALAAELSACAAAPRHVIYMLAGDLPEIAAVVLSRSPILIDGELLRFVAESGVESQIAVACRENVSPAVCAGIAASAGFEAGLALLMNPTAMPQTDTLHDLAARFGHAEEIRRLLAERGDLRAKTRVLLVEKLAEALAGEGGDRDLAMRQRAAALAAENCEKSLIALAAAADGADIGEICDAIIASGRMTAAFLLRAVLMGNIALFVLAIARLSGVAAGRVEAVAVGGQKAAFAAICAKAKLPAAVCPVYLSAIAAWKRLLDADAGRDPAELTHGVALSVLSRYEPGEDPALDALLLMLRRICGEAARLCARREIGEIARRIADERRPALPAPAASAPIEIEPAVIAAWAEHFAEELVDLESEFAGVSAVGAEFAAEVASNVAVGEAMAEMTAAFAEIPFDLPQAPENFANDDMVASGKRAA